MNNYVYICDAYLFLCKLWHLNHITTFMAADLVVLDHIVWTTRGHWTSLNTTFSSSWDFIHWTCTSLTHVGVTQQGSFRSVIIVARSFVSRSIWDLIRKGCMQVRSPLQISFIMKETIHWKNTHYRLIKIFYAVNIVTKIQRTHRFLKENNLEKS